MSPVPANSLNDKHLSDLHALLRGANAVRMDPIHYDINRLEEGKYDITRAEMVTTPHGKKVRVILSDRGRGRIGFYLGAAYSNIFSDEVINRIMQDTGYLQFFWSGREGKYYKYMVLPRDQENWE